MDEKRDRKEETQTTKTEGGRQARLEQALRNNLLKRKEKNRNRQMPQTPSEEGGQG